MQNNNKKLISDTRFENAQFLSAFQEHGLLSGFGASLFEGLSSNQPPTSSLSPKPFSSAPTSQVFPSYCFDSWPVIFAGGRIEYLLLPNRVKSK